MAGARIEKLTKCGFDFCAEKPSNDEIWQLRYGLLVVFKTKKGHANVPQRLEFEGVKLGSWVNTQRRAYRTGTLKAQRVVALERMLFLVLE